MNSAPNSQGCACRFNLVDGWLRLDPETECGYHRAARSAVSDRRPSVTIHYQRAPEYDKRIANGDDYAGDAFVRWVAVGQEPDDAHVVHKPTATSCVVGAIDLTAYVNAADISAADMPHEVVAKLQRAINAVRAPGAIDQRDRFGMCAAPSFAPAEKEPK